MGYLRGGAARCSDSGAFGLADGGVAMGLGAFGWQGGGRGWVLVCRVVVLAAISSPRQTDSLEKPLPP